MARFVHSVCAPTLLVFFSLWLLMPAQACGCGAYIPREGDAHVEQERAIVHWDGTNEDIVMALSVAGRSSEVAWILPVPAAATVALDDALQELTKPEEPIEHRRMSDGATGGAPRGAPPVTVLKRQELGPFDVSTLAATDANALDDWLATNGYVAAAWAIGTIGCPWANGWRIICDHRMLRRARWHMPTEAKQRLAVAWQGLLWSGWRSH